MHPLVYLLRCPEFLCFLLVKYAYVGVVSTCGDYGGSADGSYVVVVATCCDLASKVCGYTLSLFAGEFVVLSNEAVVSLDLRLKLLGSLLNCLVIKLVASSCKVITEFYEDLLFNSDAFNKKFNSGLLLFFAQCCSPSGDFIPLKIFLFFIFGF